MIVRQDDTVVCSVCYAESDEARAGAILPAHRHIYAVVRTGLPCEECGEVDPPA